MNSTGLIPAPLTIKEAAEKLNMSPHWVWLKVKDNKIVSIRKGDKIFISVDEINRINQEGCE